MLHNIKAPEHANTNGQPTNEYWTWAKNGWNSRKPFRYPAGKGRKPLCSLWNGYRLDYIEARKQIYIPLYQNAVKQTVAYNTLERLYIQQGHLTLFDFDGYDHRQLGMSFKEVNTANCVSAPKTNLTDWTGVQRKKPAAAGIPIKIKNKGCLLFMSYFQKSRQKRFRIACG